MRRAAVVVVGLMLVGGSTAYAGTEEPVKVNGSEEIAIIDVDQDGELGGGEDCVFRAFINGSNLRIDPDQDAHDLDLRVCNDDCTGSASMSSNFLELIINSCPNWGRPPGAPFVPADLLVGNGLLSSPSSSSAHGGASGDSAVQMMEGSLSYPAAADPEAGEGLLCDFNGPAVAVTLRNGVRVVRDLVPFPDASETTHMCVNVPFELSGFQHIFIFRNICFPITGVSGNANVTIGDDTDPVAFLSLEELPPCPAATGGRMAAPSMTALGLAALMVMLLAIGLWSVSRRRGFSEGLPLF